MATQDLPPGDSVVYEYGVQVLVTDTVCPHDMEGWVRKVAERSEQRVDWAFGMGARIGVNALGDIDRVHAAISELLPELEQLRERKREELE